MIPTHDEHADLNHPAFIHCNCGMKREHMKQLCFKKRHFACAASGEVLCLHTPSRARHSLVSVREMSNKKQLTGKKKMLLKKAIQEVCAHSFHS